MFSMKQKLYFLAALGAMFLIPGLRAQTAPPAPSATIAGADYDNRWEVSGGFAYTRLRPGFGRLAPIDWMGGAGQATLWVRPVYGFAGSVREFSSTAVLQANPYNLKSPHVHETVFLIGPDFRVYRQPKTTVGLHLLFGGAYGVFDTDLKGVLPNAVGLYSNQLAFSMATGASFDYNLSPRLSVRVVTDFQPTFYGANTQDAFAGTVGVVYKFGSLHRNQ